MELLFIWILQENNIKKQGINFSPTYRFSFDFNSGQLTMLNRSADIVENFWEAKQIINLTGIVGENGVGKTTLIDLDVYKRQTYCWNVPKHWHEETKLGSNQTA